MISAKNLLYSSTEEKNRHIDPEWPKWVMNDFWVHCPFKSAEVTVSPEASDASPEGDLQRRSLTSSTHND